MPSLASDNSNLSLVSRTWGAGLSIHGPGDVHCSSQFSVYVHQSPRQIPISSPLDALSPFYILSTHTKPSIYQDYDSHQQHTRQHHPRVSNPQTSKGSYPAPSSQQQERGSRAEISEHPEKKPIICPFFCLNQRKQHIDSACLSHPKTHLDLLVPSYAQRTVSSSLIRFEPSYLCLYFVPVDLPLVIAPAPPDCY